MNGPNCMLEWFIGGLQLSLSTSKTKHFSFYKNFLLLDFLKPEHRIGRRLLFLFFYGAKTCCSSSNLSPFLFKLLKHIDLFMLVLVFGVSFLKTQLLGPIYALVFEIIFLCYNFLSALLACV